MLCGDSTPPGHEIPSIGCFQVASGQSASGTLDGRQFTVTVDAKGGPSCRLDGAAVPCGACTDGSNDACSVKVLIVDRNADGSVLFNVQRRRNDGRYIYSREVWDGYLALQQRALSSQGQAAPQQLPEGLPPVLPRALVPAVIVQTDGPGALASVAWETQGDYGCGRFVELDALDKLSAPDQVTDDGEPRALGVANGLWDFLYNWKNWQFDLRKIAQWRREQPDSYAADIAEVTLWRAWAWHDRGEGYANSVAPEGWKLFADRLAHAQSVLDQSKPRASKTPLWYQLSLSVGRDMQWDPKRDDALFREAIERFPGYVPFYLSMSDYLSPKWGGSYEAVDKLARETVAKSGGDYSLYTRIYWNLSDEEEDDFYLFNDSLASWPLMKTGFDRLMQRYPKSLWNLNAYAAFACRARDRDTYSSLRARIGQNVIAVAWPSNQSTDVCDERLLGHA
jgi:hypothetical protein